MASIVQNISLGTYHWHVGEARTLRYDVVDSAGSPQNMTGFALLWELADQDGVVQVSKTSGGGGITIGNGDGTNDRATVTVAQADTEALTPGTYTHRLRRTDAGSELVLAYGYAELGVVTAWP